MFRGILAGFDSRRQEGLLPSLRIQVSIPGRSIESSPEVQKQRKLPKEWIHQHLHAPPVSGLETAVCVHAALVPSGFEDWLDGWEGVQVAAKTPTRKEGFLIGPRLRCWITTRDASLSSHPSGREGALRTSQLRLHQPSRPR